MEKKVIISENLFSKLLKDMDDFNYKESRNDFFSDIIINTYEMDNQYSQMEKIIDLLNGKAKGLDGNFIIEEISYLKDRFQYKDMMNQIALALTKINETSFPIVGDKKEIFIRETSRSKGLLTKILDEFGANHASEVFKNILYRYMSYPTYLREKIIHSKLVDTINECIRRKLVCKITTINNYEYIVEPYKLIPGKDEYHNYLACYCYQDNQTRKIQSFKLSTITSASRLRNTFSLSNEEHNILNERIKEGGPEYISAPLIEYKIEFDHEGIRLFDNITKDRPSCIAKEKGKINEFNGKPQQYMIYTLKCSEFQIFNYLKLFSYHASVLDNDILKNKLKEYYKKAYERFN